MFKKITKNLVKKNIMKQAKLIDRTLQDRIFLFNIKEVNLLGLITNNFDAARRVIKKNA